jgi:hypothetical protein
MSLASLKSELVQSTLCEIDMLKKANLRCANKLLNFRHGAYIRIHMIECLEPDYDENKDIIDYLYEQVKELIRLIIQSNC